MMNFIQAIWYRSNYDENNMKIKEKRKNNEQFRLLTLQGYQVLAS